ncbi:serine hydrolase domain-containing protein [Thalassotalea euphylliae]|uniref:Class A beta-lactamase-related serine hydrolase n=1 Tax=Thalassotalea euphylliae TaxID=1655234 RepID=A0A3E0UDJ2_9GAMM|nr:serine hydrolase domain-containing protein [Thalassotalea euphylliae]REL35101.1 class A beta-lactamase-related serine hydrolase [Thalassotalea euphylliae]
MLSKKLKKALLVGCAVCSVFSLGTTSVYADQNNVSGVGDFEQKLNALLAEHQLPGVVLHIEHQDKLVLHRAYGKVNINDDRNIAKDDIFRIYSMSKPLAAVALLQLVDKGLVSLEADIRDYLPAFEPFEYQGQRQRVTVHQLLSHTAGFGYGGGIKNWVDFRYLIANPLSRRNDLSDLVNDLSGIDLKFIPGSKFEYSIASDIQGAIIEAVTNKPLEEYFQHNLFEPLKMIDTGFYVPQADHRRLVDMYEYDAGTFEKAYTFNKDNILFVEKAQDSEFLTKPRLISAGGGLVSTAQDFANFADMLANGGVFEGQRILSEELISRMVSSHIQGLDKHFLPRVYHGAGFGYGIGVKEVAGDSRAQGSFFWSGLGGTVFWVDPINELQVVVMFQVEDGWVGMEKWMIEHVYPLISSLADAKKKS